MTKQIEGTHPCQLQRHIGNDTEDQCDQRPGRQRPADPVARIVEDHPDAEHEGDQDHPCRYGKSADAEHP